MVCYPLSLLYPVLCAINQVIHELNIGCVADISSPLTAGPCGRQSLVGWQSWEEVVVGAERHRGGGGAEEGCQVLGLIGHGKELDFIPEEVGLEGGFLRRCVDWFI